MSEQRNVAFTLFLLSVLTVIPAWADEESLAVSDEQVNTDGFAMDTSVFFGEKKTADIETSTVFEGRVAYDRLSGANGPIARFDFEGKVIDLLDPVSRTRTSIGFEDVLMFQASLAAKAQQEKGLVQFLSNPRFIREFDATDSTIKLSSSWVTYEAKGSQSPTDMVERFVEFADWSARLTSMMNPHAPPARARLELNAALKKQNWQVKRITRTGGPRAKELGAVHSDHAYRTSLSDSDRALIKLTTNGLNSFAKISFSKYRAARNSGRLVSKK